MHLRKDVRYVLLLLSAAIVSHLPFLMSGAFFSDEAIYTYAGLAILRGETPYIRITLPQPPLGYLFLAGEAWLTQSSLPLIRSINFTIYLVGIIFVFRLMARVSDLPHVAFVGTLIYILFPPLISSSFSAPLEFTYFVTLTFVGLDLALANCTLSLFGAGVFFGLAGMTWYPGFFGLIGVLGYLIVNRLRNGRTLLNALTGAGLMLLGSLAIISSLLAVIALFWRSYVEFLTQSLALQTGLRAGFSQAEKLYVLNAYLDSFSPLILVGATGVMFAIVRLRDTRRFQKLFLVVWFVMVFAFLALIPKVLFPHYFWFLTPVLCFFAANTLLEFVSALKRRTDNLRFVVLLSILATASALAFFGANSYPTNAFGNNIYTASEEYVGHYVANLTAPSQLIWTSEAGIAFYANRMIAPPNSTVWKVQGFFDDVFNTSYTDTAMFQHQGSGLVSPVQFEQSWNSNVQVLIFIRGDGPVPYPDTLLWDGWSGTLGVSSWVESHYTRIVLLAFTGNPYWYEVWVRD